MKTPWLNREYTQSDGIKSFPVNIGNNKFTILINPQLGSWVALTEQDYARYVNNELSQLEWETLFLRKLAIDKNGEDLELDFLEPANFPSVVVVNITTHCNLLCKYCFAKCESVTGENMTEDVMDKTIDNMFNMPENQTITFEFQGGEVALNVPGLQKFIEKVENKRKSSSKVVKYRTVTNCTKITEEFINLIKKYNVILGISLDGPKEMNDSYRCYPNGEGSFDEIKKGITKLRENGINIDGAVCSIGQHNVNNPKEMLAFFDEMKISFKPRPINILGREIENNLTTKPGEWAKCFKSMHQLRDNYSIENFSIHIFEENVYTPIRDYICLRYPCGAAREVISVNPNGDVVPCDGFKAEDGFIMGNILKESVLEMLDKEEIKKLRARDADTIPKCKDCLFRGMCCSCCYSAFGKFGDIYREDPHCRDRKEIFLYLIKSWIKNNMLN